MNGELSSVSCPTVSLCVVVSDAGQVFTYSTPLSSPLPGTSNSSPLPSTSTPSGNGLTTPGESTLVNPPTKLHTPLVNDRTGEVTLEYDFPEPGQVEAYGKVIDGVALPSSQASHGAMRRRLVASKARRGQSRKCKTRHVGKRRQCANNAPLYYRQVAFDIRSAGGYKLRIKPSLSGARIAETNTGSSRCDLCSSLHPWAQMTTSARQVQSKYISSLRIEAILRPCFCGLIERCDSANLALSLYAFREACPDVVPTVDPLRMTLAHVA